MNVRVFLALGACLILVPAFARPQDKQAGEDLKTKVLAHVKALESGSAADKTAAEWELIKLGPEILDLLPGTEKSPQQLQERISAVRYTLLELKPRRWSVKESQISFDLAVEKLVSDTGMPFFQDIKRPDIFIDIGVSIDPRKSSYWEVVDVLASRVGRLSLYEPSGIVTVKQGEPATAPLSLHGPFRVAVKRIGTRLDFDGKTHNGVLCLELAWEPRFSPYLIEVGKLSFQAAATTKESNPVTVPGTGKVAVVERIAKEFDVVFPAPARSVSTLQNVSGHFVLTMPVKSLDFGFKEPKQGDGQTQDGVRVAISKFDADKDWVTVELGIDVPAAGPKFESFQTWLGSNSWLDQLKCQIAIPTPMNALRMIPPDPLRIQVLGAPSAIHVGVRYRFAAKSLGGDPSHWRLLCRVPGRMVETTVPFSFERIDLP